MTLIERIENRIHILKLLKEAKLFTAKELAQKFNCSTKTVQRLLDELRAEGHIIKYDRPNKKYVLVKNEDTLL